MSILAILLAAAAQDSIPSLPPPAPVIVEQPRPDKQPLSGTSQVLAEKPKLLNTKEIFNSDTYPFWAKDLGEDGTVRVEVQVAPTGAATACRVIEPSGSALLDVGTCDLIMGRGRFSPARDKNRKPVAGALTRTVTWTMQPRPAMAFVNLHTRVVYVVDKSLQATNCRVEQQPVFGFDPRICSEMRPIAQAMIAKSPVGFQWDELQIVIENSQFVGAGDAARLVGKRRGDILFDRTIIRVTANPEGHIHKCDVLEIGHTPLASKESWCADTMREAAFSPWAEKEDRLMTYVRALYLQTKF